MKSWKASLKKWRLNCRLKGNQGNSEERKVISYKEKRRKTGREWGRKWLHGSERVHVGLNWIPTWDLIWKFCRHQTVEKSRLIGLVLTLRAREVTVVFWEGEFKSMFIINLCGLEEWSPPWREMWLGTEAVMDTGTMESVLWLAQPRGWGSIRNSRRQIMFCLQARGHCV